MLALRNVLVVLDDDAEEARYVLEKTAMLVRASGARVHAVRVVYEGIADLSASAIDAAADLKTFILQAEETITEELVEPSREHIPGLETATLWNRRPWEGALHAAQRVDADLIVKAASRHPRFGEFVRTPDDWNLLRSAEVPVMLMKPLAWVNDPVVLCAVDAFDERHDELNVALLEQGIALAEALQGSLDVVAAYPLFERWVGELGGLRDYESLRQDVEREIRDRVQSLAETAGVRYRRLYADEGTPEQVIATLAEQLPAELVVVGTHARGGVAGVVLGNTSERLIHHLDTDVVTVGASSSRSGGAG